MASGNLSVPHRRTWMRSTSVALVALLNVAGACYYGFFYFSNGYLPSPFIFDKSDTFMDFFHPMFWADRDGRYSEWGSVYPPLNFLFLKVLGWLFVEDGNSISAFALREHAKSLQFVLVAAYVFVPIFLVSRPYWGKFSGFERLAFGCIALTCAPMLFALERGNLVIFSLALLPLAIFGKPLGRTVAIAILVNLKPYFALLFLVYVAKRRWQDLFVGVVMAGGLFVATGLLLDREFLMFPENLLAFSGNENLFSPREVMSMPSSVSAFSYVFRAQGGQRNALGFLDDIVGVLPFLIDVTKWMMLLLSIWVIAYASRSVADCQVLSVLVVLITNLGVSVGGYTLIFYCALVPVLAEMRLRRVYLVILAAIALPLDWLVLMSASMGQQFAYLSGTRIDVEWALGLGSVLRPVLNLALLACISWELYSKCKLQSARFGSNLLVEGASQKKGETQIA